MPSSRRRIEELDERIRWSKVFWRVQSADNGHCGEWCALGVDAVSESHEQRVQRELAENVDTVLEHGPGLRWSYNTPALAVDRSRGYVLLGGLGAMGVGRMWCKIEDVTEVSDDVPDDPYITDSFGCTAVDMAETHPPG